MTLKYGALALTALTLAAGSAVAARQQHVHRPDPAGAHGAAIMGFSQTETSHHFRLSPAGGAIEVHVHDPANEELRRHIAQHLKMVAEQFQKGDFATPFAIHSRMPDGADAMSARRDRLSFTFEEGALGGRIVIRASDAETAAAVHAFLRFQIAEHRTGDSLLVLE